MNKHTITQVINDSIGVKELLLNDDIVASILESARLVASTLNNDSKILLAGNGGSAADSQHIAAEFVSRFMFDRPAMAAIALTTDTSALTAIGNDYGFPELFARQIQALGRTGDTFIAFSTSGKSENLLNAAKTANKLGLTTIGFAGNGGYIWSEFDHVIRVPSSITARIQECHILIGHIVCQLVEAQKWSN